MNIEFFYNGIKLILSKHAKERFTTRWNALNNTRDLTDFEKEKYKYFTPKCQRMMSDPKSIDLAIVQLFNNAKTISTLSNKSKERAEQYGAQTRVLRNYPFEFIISDNIIATIEICANEIRYLNDV